MFTYIPSSNLAANPPIIVTIHYCGGTAQAYYNESPYARLADQYGFIVIYPSSPYRHTCWDVSSKESLTHNGGGDSNSIANMVTYALATYNGDASRVFVTGSSSGAMMTVDFSSHKVTMTLFARSVVIRAGDRTSSQQPTHPSSQQQQPTPACQRAASSQATTTKSMGGTAPVPKATSTPAPNTGPTSSSPWTPDTVGPVLGCRSTTAIETLPSSGGIIMRRLSSGRGYLGIDLRLP